MSTASAWVEIGSTRDLTVFNKFERAFRHLQTIAEQRTRMRLHFSRAFLKSVFRSYSDTVVAEAIHEGRRDGLSNLPVQMPYVLAGALLRSFDIHYFDHSEDRDPERVNIARSTMTTEGYFIIAFCVEYYIFLAYKRIGHDYVPGFDPLDVSLVEHILDYVDYSPEGFRPKLSYKIIFRSIGKKLAFDPR